MSKTLVLLPMMFGAVLVGGDKFREPVRSGTGTNILAER